MRLLLFLALAATACAAPRVVYSKFFKGSVPESVTITIESDGAGTFNDSPELDPLKFRLTPAQTTALFAMADKLDHFKRPLESGLKVAQMGIKTFRYENGAEIHETKFNYSLDEDAKALQDWFEKIAETEECFIVLDRSIHFDKLGVNQALLQTEETYDKDRLIDPNQFQPLLERIIKNESFLHIARDRAAKLSDAFKKPKVKPAE